MAIKLFRRVKSATQFLFQDFTRIGYAGLSQTDATYVKLGYESNADLFAVINLLTSNASQVKPILFSGDKEVLNHPILDLLKQPTPGTTYRKFIAQSGGYYWITGDAYIYAPILEVGQNAGKTKQLIVLPSQCVTPKMNADGTKYYEYKNGTIQATYQANEILHISTPNYDPTEPLKGMSPIKPALMNLSASNEGTKSQAMRFQNGGMDGMLGVKDAKTEEQIKGVKAQLKEQSGADGAGRLLVTSSGLDFVRFGLSPADLQVLATIGWNRTVFCNLYGVDPHLIDPSVGSTYNNQKEAVKSLYNRAIIPFMDELFSGLQNWLVVKYGAGLRLDIGTSEISELQEDKAAKVTWLKDAWWLTGNERRTEIDYEPLTDPEMDLIIYPNGNTPGLDDVAETQLGKRGAADYRT